MSRDVKYIGMDVHKEAIVIAVVNDGGKLTMESIIETQASENAHTKSVHSVTLGSLFSEQEVQPIEIAPL